MRKNIIALVIFILTYTIIFVSFYCYSTKDDIKPQRIPLEIIYEDENMAVVNKPSGMLTHPTDKETKNTLVNALLYKYGNNLSDIAGPERRGIVHRLDQNTSGLLMIAKNNDAHMYLKKQINEHTITKKYRAIVVGDYPTDKDEIRIRINKDPETLYKMCVVPNDKAGKDCLTKLKVLERFGDITYIEVNLLTGRTHQIRLSTSHRGYPIYNDELYGAKPGIVKTQQQVLQSYYLKFKKPFSGEEIELQIEPDDKIQRVLDYYRNNKN